jgi:hypothetical protein
MPEMRKSALITAITGGLLSVLLMVHAGRYSMPPLLIVLIGMWVLLPYDALMVGNILSPRWSERTRVTLYRLTFVIALVSVAIYASAAFGPPRPKPAFFFVIVPPLSLLLIGVALFVARSRSHHGS